MKQRHVAAWEARATILLHWRELTFTFMACLISVLQAWP